MNIEWFPQHLAPDSEGDVRKFIRKQLKKHRDLVLRVEQFLDRVLQSASLQPFYDDETIQYLSGDDIYEMRIPKTRRGGVVRIYFCKNPLADTLTLVLLDAELKDERAPGRVTNAKKRMKSFLSDLQRGQHGKEK